MLPYAKDQGCATFGAIGTCWGSYMVVRMAADPLVSAGVSMHPSHPNIIPQMGEDEEEILSKIQVHLLVNNFFFCYEIGLVSRPGFHLLMKHCHPMFAVRAKPDSKHKLLMNADIIADCDCKQIRSWESTRCHFK